MDTTPLAADGSPLPRRGTPSFERDVRAMFTYIAGQYSLFDHLATLGQDLLWRPRALWEVDRRRTRPVRHVLDLGCGPGDLTFLLAHHYPGSRVTALDFTRAMVRRGQGQRERRASGDRCEFGVADALHLPIRSGTMDLVTSAFLIRNLPDLDQGLREMRRVLAPGGVLLALEVGEPASPSIGPGFHAYFDRVVPKLGALFGTEGPYRYLSDSLRHFPSRPAVLEKMSGAGFQGVAALPQSMGIVTNFLGSAPGPGRS